MNDSTWWFETVVPAVYRSMARLGHDNRGPVRGEGGLGTSSKVGQKANAPTDTMCRDPHAWYDDGGSPKSAGPRRRSGMDGEIIRALLENDGCRTAYYVTSRQRYQTRPNQTWDGEGPPPLATTCATLRPGKERPGSWLLAPGSWVRRVSRTSFWLSPCRFFHGAFVCALCRCSQSLQASPKLQGLQLSPRASLLH
jgi:hypothetical protein